MENLLGCLQEQSDLLAEFTEALKTETALLLDNPTDLGLAEITTLKNDYARRLAELDEKREAAMADMGFTNDAGGVEAACQAYPDLRDAFGLLWELAHEAEALNQQNGQILQTYIGHNQRALETLHSLINTELYDAQGKITRSR